MTWFHLLNGKSLRVFLTCPHTQLHLLFRQKHKCFSFAVSFLKDSSSLICLLCITGLLRLLSRPLHLGCYDYHEPRSIRYAFLSVQSVRLFSSLFFWPLVAVIYITFGLKHLMELSRIPPWKVICLTNVFPYPVRKNWCAFPSLFHQTQATYLYFHFTVNFYTSSQSEPRDQSSHPALVMSASNLHVQAKKCSVDCWVWWYLHKCFRQTFLGISCLCLSSGFHLLDFSNSFIEWWWWTVISQFFNFTRSALRYENSCRVDCDG